MPQPGQNIGGLTGGGGGGGAGTANQRSQVVLPQAAIGLWKKAATPASVKSARNVRRLSCHHRSRGRLADRIFATVEDEMAIFRFSGKHSW